MPLARRVLLLIATACLCATLGLVECASGAQQAPPASGARILLLPKRIVSGERATLAVLDVSGRLTPGVSVHFSNGDQLTTDASGRALFVAPLNPGVIYASLAAHAARVYTTILSPAEAASPSLEVSAAPRLASLADRFELSGRGFCGEADANQVRIAGHTALVLASSPTSLVVLPPGDLDSGAATVELACAKHSAPAFAVTFVSLSLEADDSPLTPGERRTLTVRARGASVKVPLEARNLSPDVADLVGGNPLRISTSGGPENVARFDLAGRQRGSFLISIRLLPTPTAPHP
jgi:hypothetical protein